MDDTTLLVLSDPIDGHLAMLEQLPPGTSLAVGTTLEVFERVAADATVILNWSSSSAWLREVLPLCPRVRWVHTRSAGLDEVLFPELVERPLVLTNGSGVFSDYLGEFVLGAIIFAKGFRRLLRSQAAGVWEPFGVRDIAGQTVGIVGYRKCRAGGRGKATTAAREGARVAPTRRWRGAGPDEWTERVYGRVERVEIMALCDYIVVSTPLTEDTRGMIGEAEFSAMKPEAVVIDARAGDRRAGPRTGTHRGAH